MPKITAMDHLVLTVANIDDTCAFYETILGMETEAFTPADGSQRWALKFGNQKINLHQQGQEFDPKAQMPTSGSADLCFLTESPLEVWQEHFEENSVAIIEGPVARTGASGPITSLYIRDPNGNLVEVSIREK